MRRRVSIEKLNRPAVVTSPVEHASFFSQIFYLWLNPLFSLSRKVPLSFSHLHPCPSTEKSELLTNILENFWNKEKCKKTPSLFRALVKAHSKFLSLTAATIFIEIVCYTIRPYVLNQILLGFDDLSARENKQSAVLFCSLLVCLTLVSLFVRNSTFWMAYLMGLRLRIGSSGLVYRKILKLNQKSLSATASGQVINLLSTDAQRFELSFMFVHYAWIGPLQAIAVFWLMGEITFYPTICAAAVMIFFIPMQTIMNRAYAKIKMRICRITDARIRLISDVINGIRIVKLHAWEPLFSKFINEIRRRETRLFIYIRLCQAFQFTQLVYQIKVATMAMLLAIVLLHPELGDPEPLRSNQLFTLLNYLNSLFISLTLFLPMCIQYFYDTTVSCSRIQKFLLIPELEGDQLPLVDHSPSPMVSMNNVYARWSNEDNRFVLSDVSFEISGPRLIAVVGPVGSGKTSLLQAILGELPYTKGSVTRCSNVAYMPQLSWVFPGTVRENVLGSFQYEPSRYMEVLKATTLNVDVSRFSHGDLTQVGERGVSLSGGQKARIGLARAAYTSADLLLLDDPLAAVDARVASHLFEHCICGMLSNRLRVLVTHQHHLLPKVDKIIVMKEGRIAHFGTYNQLLDQGVDFALLRDEAPKRTVPVESTLNDHYFLSKKESFGNHTTTPGFANQMQKNSFLSDKFTNHVNSRRAKSARGLSSFRRELNRPYFIDNVERHGPDADPNCIPEVLISQSTDRLEHPPTPSDYYDKRLISSTEIHGPKSFVRKRLTEKDSSCSHPNDTPRGSITSRFAFSMENVLASGMIDRLSVNIGDDEVKELSDHILDETEELPPEEEYRRGSVSWKFYIILGRIGGGWFGVFGTLFLFIATIVNSSGCDVWLSEWSTVVDSRQLLGNASNLTLSNDFVLWDMSSNRFNLLVYCLLTVSLILLSSLRSLAFYVILINSSKRLHDGMLRACLATRLKFFEVNTSGRILNRFSKDIGQIDDYLPTTIHDFLQCFFVVCSIGVVIILSSYWVLIPTVPLLILFYIIRRYYLFTSRDLKRIESVTRSPVFSWVNVTIQGLPCIRAAANEAHQIDAYNKLVDAHTSVFYVNIAAARWLSIRLDLLCFGFIFSVVAVCLLLGFFSHISSANVGLMITYSTGLVGLFQWCTRQSAEVENQMVSVERTVEYMELMPEMTSSPLMVSTEGWPTQGEIVFHDVWSRYDPNGPWALRGINLQIQPGQKVGIVGRTGAGKSSLISTIFRLVEIEEGTITVDGIDIAHVLLADLRKRISIIPQDPIMFSGTIRSNMDPESHLDDAAIWSALDSVQLGSVIANLPGGLDSTIVEGGLNFSTGQRQLLALARAILGGNQILVVDEATANVDPETDAVIQKTLRSQFSSCTVLTVAHRLRTVIDNEVIVVMDGGRIIEMGAPHALLNPQLAERDNKRFHADQEGKRDESPFEEVDGVSGSGPLARLVRQTGLEEAKLLAQTARDAYIKMLSLKPHEYP